MKNFKKNGIILLLITVIVMYFILKDNFTLSIKMIMNASIKWILIAALCFIISFMIETVLFYNIVKQYKKNYKFKNSFKLCVMTKFFNGITPFSTGGQPFQVWILNKQGIKVSDGTNVIIENIIFFQSALTIMAITSLILNSCFGLFKYEPLQIKLTIIGFILNTLLIIALFSVSLSKTFCKRIATKIINWLYKIKIIKSKDTKLEKISKWCDEYYEGFQTLKKNRKFLVSGILIEIVATCFYFAVPYCVFNALGVENTLTIPLSIITQTYVFVSGSYFIIPGGTGGIEYAFYNYFKNFSNELFIAPVLLIWRFITYYIPMIIGSLVFNFAKSDYSETEKPSK